jgi:hypothetical protein
VDITCQKCVNSKPRIAFRKLASLAQTRAILKNPFATKRIWVFGNICAECHKQAKRKPSELSAENYRKHLINEGMPAELADMAYAARRAKGKRKLAEGARKALRKVRSPEINAHLSEITKAIAALKARVRYLCQHDAEHLVPYDFLQTSYGYCTQARRQLIERRRAARPAPKCWQELINIDSWVADYDALDSEQRSAIAKQMRRFLWTGVHKLTGDRFTHFS